MKERILNCFNKSAETYDAAAVLQTRVAKSLIQRITNFPATKILEIGCGTGIFSHEILNKFRYSSFLLTDLAPEMVNICKQRFISNRNVNWMTMDGEKITAKENFDLIVSSMVVHWFLDIKKSFERIIEILPPKGIFAFSMVGKNSLPEWRSICNNPSFSAHHFPSAEMLQFFFPGMKIYTEMIVQPYPSAYEFLKSLKNLGAVATANHYQPLSSGKLRSITRKYEQCFNVSYEIIYGEYIKHE